MYTKIEEQEFVVESKVESLRLIKNVILQAENIAKKSQDITSVKSLRKIYNAFEKYKNSTDSILKDHVVDVVPVIITRKINDGIEPVWASVDERVLALKILVNMLSKKSKNRHIVPDDYKGRDLHFTVKGWPVAYGTTQAEHANYDAWQAFVKAAVRALKQAIPKVDLSAWLGTEVNQEQLLATVDMHRSTKTAPDPKILPVNVATPDERDVISPKHVTLNVSLPEEEQPLIAPQVSDFNDWPTAPKSLKTLIKQLSEMYQYGMKLQSDAPEKAETIMTLAVTLFKDLKKHYESDAKLNRNAHKDFEFNFKRTLHSHDDLMDSHRKYWKVIIANTALALTGIGTFAVFISLAVRGHGFFNKTKSHQMVEELNNEINNVIPVK